jgi:hypothetical protein
MANQLAMADVQAILKLHESRWSNRRIAQELHVDRETVAKYIRAAACDSKSAKAPIGSPGVSEAQGNAGWPAPAVASAEEKGIAATIWGCSPEPVWSDSRPAKAPIGSDPIPAEAPIGSERLSELVVASQASPGVGQAGAAASAPPCGRSACEPYRQVILEKLEQGLSAQRIYQDLAGDGFAHKYHSVRRFSVSEELRQHTRRNVRINRVVPRRYLITPQDAIVPNDEMALASGLPPHRRV